MKQQIKNQITACDSELNKLRSLILSWNLEIENNQWVPSNFQKNLIQTICNKGKFILKQKERLNQLLNQINNQ